MPKDPQHDLNLLIFLYFPNAWLSGLARLINYGIVRMSSSDLAEVLQARIRANLEARKIAHTPPSSDELLRIDNLQLNTAALEEAVADAEVLGEQRRQEAEQAAKKDCGVGTPDLYAAGGDWQGRSPRRAAASESPASAKRADHFLAEIIDMTGEFGSRLRKWTGCEQNSTIIGREHSRLADACNCGSQWRGIVISGVV